jgi:hypothetical protein
MPRRPRVITSIVVLVLAGVAIASPSNRSTQLIGKTGFSLSAASGWLDIPPTDFSRGDHLVISIGGTATAIVVRLLPKGFDPDQPDVIVADRASVRTDRTIDIALNRDFKEIIQVSVHGGSRPWNRFQLGSGNGNATLQRAERVTP